LFALQDCEYIALLEDDLIPTKNGWFEEYEKAAALSGIHHFCRVQDKEIPELSEEFSAFMRSNELTPIYGSSPRGDLTFISSKVVKEVGALNPEFMGVGCGHGEFSERVFRAGLIPHPNKWVDIQECRDSFIQKGDREGGRWDVDRNEIKRQIETNKKLLKKLKKEKYVFYPLIMY
jgi:hypothetical protein